MKIAAAVFHVVAMLQLVSADWRFKSRTDLAPPRLNTTIPATEDVDKATSSLLLSLVSFRWFIQHCCSEQPMAHARNLPTLFVMMASSSGRATAIARSGWPIARRLAGKARIYSSALEVAITQLMDMDMAMLQFWTSIMGNS